MTELEKSMNRIQENFENHALSDSRFQADSAERDIGFDKRLGVIEERIKSVPTKEDIAYIVNEEMTKFFEGKGRLGFTILTTTAAIVVSLAAIFGGFKVLADFLFYRQ